MTYFIIGLAGIILILSGGLAIAVKVSKSRGLKVKELEDALEAFHDQVKKQSEYQDKREEAQKKSDEKKETLHTGNSSADFDNSLNLLHGASKK